MVGLKNSPVWLIEQCLLQSPESDFYKILCVCTKVHIPPQHRPDRWPLTSREIVSEKWFYLACYTLGHCAWVNFEKHDTPCGPQLRAFRLDIQYLCCADGPRIGNEPDVRSECQFSSQTIIDIEGRRKPICITIPAKCHNSKNNSFSLTSGITKRWMKNYEGFNFRWYSIWTAMINKRMADTQNRGAAAGPLTSIVN